MPRGVKTKPDCKKVQKLLHLFADGHGNSIPTGDDILAVFEFTYRHGQLDDASLAHLRWSAELLMIYARDRRVRKTPAQHRRFMRKVAASQKEIDAYKKSVRRRLKAA